jgi:hypothetical protein
VPQAEAMDSSWHKATRLHYRTIRLYELSVNATSNYWVLLARLILVYVLLFMGYIVRYAPTLQEICRDICYKKGVICSLSVYKTGKK